MVVGVVESDLQAVVGLSLVGSSEELIDVMATIDTGFNGFITLPQKLIDSLGCERIAEGEATLADGTIETFDMFLAEVVWDGHKRVVEADRSEGEILVGMAMLQGHNLRIEVREGGTTTIEAFALSNE